MTLLGYVLRDLFRNPRRTLTSLVGVIVGVGLFSAVLFFIDGSGASLTRRALAPLTLDSQLVLTAPLGGGLRFEQALAADALESGGKTLVTLTVTNDGLAPAHEVVIRDHPSDPTTYLPGSTSLDGAEVKDVESGPPFYQGKAGIGLNIGTVEPGASHRVTYLLRAASPVPVTANLPVNATVSAREARTPAPANAPPATSLRDLTDRVAGIPGVRAANPLVLVEMDPGTLSANGVTVPGPVKLFAFDSRYQANYPSITMLSGGFEAGSVLVSAETARALTVSVGDSITITLPGARPLVAKVSGITDLSIAKPLFESRESSRLEKFVYVPFTVVVDHEMYRADVEPAFEGAAAARDSRIYSLPLEEVDILLDRSVLNADPATAGTQTRLIAAGIQGFTADQAYLIDNISNALLVAEGDADIAKRLFVFLGLPGAILAAVLTAYAGNLLAEAQRRENALLRVRGAGMRHLLHLLVLRTIAIAGIGSLMGMALGFVTVVVLLGSSILFEASPSALVQSAAIGAGGGMLVTALALYVPGRRLISTEITQELAIVSRRAIPGWRRFHLDVVVLVIAFVAQLIALQLGAFDAPAGSVYAGQSVSLPLQLLIPPILAWLAGTLLIARVLYALTERAASRHTPPRFGSLLPGVLWRSITRRLAALTGGVVTLALVVGLGTMLASFATVYDKAQVTDARFLVGSDIRLTPNPTNPTEHPTTLTSELTVDGVSGATAVVYSLENAVLTSEFNEDVATLAAIDPATYRGVAALQDSLFMDGSSSRMISLLEKRPDGVFVNTALAQGLKLSVGDRAELLLARDTDQQTRRPVVVLGLLTLFPGAPTGTDIVANLGFYERETGLKEADYYLLHTADRSSAGLERALQSLSGIQGFHERFDVNTTVEAVNKDQSSLTALNVRGLLQIDSLFTFLMAATATAMFVFGLLMQRRREYVTMRAQGMHAREIRWLVLAESGISTILGTVIGLIIGIGMASQFVYVLRPIFTLAPPLDIPFGELALLVALVLGATALSSVVAAILIGRMKPTELLRDE
ncbi:FtsX-like permease family protein [Salinibacterium sp.]|uniref:FtsX-like permease family protein n=1 Tax=Salinibacterium sp. TaxID=1915057 RepID=UPI00286BC22A|nr:FtsX-like permease family protein [Salinibacterium sp.]